MCTHNIDPIILGKDFTLISAYQKNRNKEAGGWKCYNSLEDSFMCTSEIID